MQENSLTQLAMKPTREDIVTDLLFVDREDLVGDLGGEGHLGRGNHKL